MNLEQLKARMNEIKDELTALEDALHQGSQEEKVIASQKAGELQQEGRRLGNEFRTIRKEQKEAVDFVEELLNKG